MNQKRINLLMVTLLLTLTGNVYSASTTNKGLTPNGKPFIELNGQIIEVQGTVTTLREQVDSLVETVSTSENRIFASEVAIIYLEHQNSILSQMAANQSTNIQVLIDNFSEIYQATEILEAQIQDAEVNDDVVSAKVEANKQLMNLIYIELMDGNQTLLADIEANAVSLQSLQDMLNASKADLSLFQHKVNVHIETNNSLLYYLNKDLTLLEADLALKQNLINGTCAEGSSIREIMEDGAVVCEIDNNTQPTHDYPYTVINTLHSIGDYQSEVYFSHCPPGMYVSGGGYSVSSDVQDHFRVYSSGIDYGVHSSTQRTAWAVRGESDTSSIGTLEVSAICMGQYSQVE